MEKMKMLVTILACAFGIAFLDGVFGWELASGFYMLLGLVDLVCIMWMLMLVYKK